MSVHNFEGKIWEFSADWIFAAARHKAPVGAVTYCQESGLPGVNLKLLKFVTSSMPCYSHTGKTDNTGVALLVMSDSPLGWLGYVEWNVCENLQQRICTKEKKKVSDIKSSFILHFLFVSCTAPKSSQSRSWRLLLPGRLRSLICAPLFRPNPLNSTNRNIHFAATLDNSVNMQ